MTIKDICSTHGLTQKALSERFGIPLRTIEDWAGGRRKPPEYVVNMIVEILAKDRATLESVAARMTGCEED